MLGSRALLGKQAASILRDASKEMITKAFEDEDRSSLPWALTLVVATTFAVMISIFFIYDTFVRQRNDKVVGHTTVTSAIVTYLFPKNVRTGRSSFLSSDRTPNTNSSSCRSSTQLLLLFLS